MSTCPPLTRSAAGSRCPAASTALRAPYRATISLPDPRNSTADPELARGRSAPLTASDSVSSRPRLPAGRRASVKPCSMPIGPATYHSCRPDRCSVTRLPRAVTDVIGEPASDSDSVPRAVRSRAGPSPNVALTPPPVNRQPAAECRALKRLSDAPSVAEIADWAAGGSDCTPCTPSAGAGTVKVDGPPMAGGPTRCSSATHASAQTAPTQTRARVMRPPTKLMVPTCHPPPSCPIRSWHPM